jgi:hypothetical protein
MGVTSAEYGHASIMTGMGLGKLYESTNLK